MTLNFDFQIKNLKGEPFDGDVNNASNILSNFLAVTNKGNSMKLWDWAQKIYKKEELNLDKTDLEVLQALVENTENLPVITKAQILEVIKKEIHK